MKAILRVTGLPTATSEERKNLAAWLRKLATDLNKSPKDYDKAFTARLNP